MQRTHETRWRLTEELRIGAVADEGPDLFGRITSLAVDGAGRIYVLEGQAQVEAGPDGSEEDFRLGLIRYDSALTPLDTLSVPDDPVERERFEFRREHSVHAVR